MSKKIVITSLIVGMVLFYGMVICKNLALNRVSLDLINIQLIGLTFEYGLVLCTVIAYIASFYHFFIKDFIPFRKFEES